MCCDCALYVVFIAVFTVTFLYEFTEECFYFADNLKSQYMDVEFLQSDSPTWGKTFRDVQTVSRYSPPENHSNLIFFLTPSHAALIGTYR